MKLSKMRKWMNRRATMPLWTLIAIIVWSGLSFINIYKALR